MHAHIHCTNDKNTNEIEPVNNGVLSLVCPADMLYSMAKEIGDLDHDIMIHEIIYSHLSD